MKPAVLKEIIRNISLYDYILWDVVNDYNVEDLIDTYHYSEVIKMFNNGYKLDFNQEFVPIANLPLSWQKRISDAIYEESKYI